MNAPKLFSLAAAMALALLFYVPSLSAQDGPPPPPPADSGTAAGASGGGQGADRMAQFRQRMAERLKAALKVNDEEWSAIQPLIEKIMAKQREANGGRGFGGGRRGGPGGDQAGQQGNRPPDRPSQPEAEALQKALDSDSTPAADIKTKLEAVRAARKKASGELDQAREDLRKVLTQRQEATLVLMGILQ